MCDQEAQAVIDLQTKVIQLQDIIIKKLVNEVQEGQDMAQALANQVDEMGNAMVDRVNGREEKSEDTDSVDPTVPHGSAPR